MDGSEQRPHISQQIHNVYRQLPLPHGAVWPWDAVLCSGLLLGLQGKLPLYCMQKDLKQNLHLVLATAERSLEVQGHLWRLD